MWLFGISSPLKFIPLRNWLHPSSHFELGSVAARRDKGFISSYVFNTEVRCFIKFLPLSKEKIRAQLVWIHLNVLVSATWNVSKLFGFSFLFFSPFSLSRISYFTQSLMYSVGKKRFLCVRTAAEHQTSDGDLSRTESFVRDTNTACIRVIFLNELTLKMKKKKSPIYFILIP